MSDIPTVHEEYLGEYFLIGLTYVDDEGHVTHQRQIHGRVIATSETTLYFELEGRERGRRCSTPFHPPAIEPAPPGIYTLSESGDEVEDPDYLTVWTVTSGYEGDWLPGEERPTH